VKKLLSYSIQQTDDWVYVNLMGYTFKDFYYCEHQLNWLTDYYGSPTYEQSNMKVFGGNSAFVTLLDGKTKDDDPVYRFGFKQSADAVNFYLSLM